MPLFQERRVVRVDHGGRLNVAIGNDVVIRLSQREGDFKTKLVGLYPFDFIILKLPPVPGLKDKLIKGSDVIVRYLNHGVVYGFNAQVLAFTSNPCLMVFLSYPQQYETLSLRKCLRIQCLIPCKVYTEHGEYNGYIIDLGEGGCRINFAAKEAGELPELETGSDVYLDFTLCGHQKLFVIKGLLRHVLEGVEKFSLGIEFKGISREQQEYLTSYILEVSKAC